MSFGYLEGGARLHSLSQSLLSFAFNLVKLSLNQAFLFSLVPLHRHMNPSPESNLKFRQLFRRERDTLFFFFPQWFASILV